MTEITKPKVELAVEMRAIVKRFPGVLANDRVDFILDKGEIHALLGENGAGKSTLMNILAGMYQPDEGTIRVFGKERVIASPKQALAMGIGMVHQHFMLVPTLTVAENIILGMPRPRFFIDPRKIEGEIAEISAKTGLKADPKARIWQLSVGEQQRVEILKMLYRGVRILIMDEPTAVLTPQEAEELFQTLSGMADDGKSIVFISHKLDEVLRISHRITVLRKGSVSARNMRACDTSKPDLARLMVGHDVESRVRRKESKISETALILQDVFASNDQGFAALRGISLEVRASEILGIAGVSGNGQRELAQVIMGTRKMMQGKVLIYGKDMTNRPVRERIEAGVAHIPEDRMGTGIIPDMTLAENLVLKRYRDVPFARRSIIQRQGVEDFARQCVEAFDIAAPSIDVPSRLLSGGNLQKMILARELSGKPRLIVAVHPTHGVDIGSTEMIHRLLLEQRDGGAAILLISEDLDEVLKLSDRLIVLCEGKITGEMLPSAADREKLGLMMSGAMRDPT